MRKLLFISFAFFILLSCEDENPEIKIKDLLTVNTGYINYDEEAKTFLVISNNTSDLKYVELQNDSTYIIKSKNNFLKDKIHIHVLEYNHHEENLWYVKSYFNVSKGKTMNLSVSKNNKSTSSYSVYVDFDNIPGYDFVTLSAMYRGHCHTQTTFDLVCSPSGYYQTMDEDFRYYVCLQDELGGKYKLKDIPKNVSNHTISLDNLSSDMAMHTFPKMINDKEIQKIKIKGYDNSKSFEIFNMENDIIDLFTDNIIAYFPNDEFQSFSTYMRYEKDDYYYTNEVLGDVTNEFTFMDAVLTVSGDGNSFPEIDTDGAFNYSYVAAKNDAGFWYSYTDKTDNLVFPEIPAEMFGAEALNGMMNSLKSFRIELNYFPNSEISYQDVIDNLIFDGEEPSKGNTTIIHGYFKTIEK